MTTPEQSSLPTAEPSADVEQMAITGQLVREAIEYARSPGGTFDHEKVADFLNSALLLKLKGQSQ